MAIMDQFFNICSIGWPFAIAVTLWGTFVRDWPQSEAWDRQLLIIYSASIGGLSVTLTCLPFMDGNLYGDTGDGWCWIEHTTTTGKVLIFVCFYGWLWLVIILI